jgi:hypothetical protein
MTKRTTLPALIALGFSATLRNLEIRRHCHEDISAISSSGRCCVRKFECAPDFGR